MAANNNNKDSRRKSARRAKKYSPIQQKNIHDSIRAIKDIYGEDVPQKVVNSILGNIAVETNGFKDLRENAWTWDNIQQYKNNPDYKSINRNIQKWGGSKSDYNKLSQGERLSVMYYGDTDHADVAGGTGSLHLTSANYGGNDKSYNQYQQAAKELGIDPSKIANDFYTSTLATLKVFQNRGQDMSKYQSPIDLRKKVINPHESLKSSDHRMGTLSYFDTDQPLEFGNAISEGSSSVNPQDILNNPNLDDAAKEELLKMNASEGLEQSTIDNLNQHSGQSLLSGYGGQVDLSQFIVDEDIQAKQKKMNEARAQLGFKDNIQAFDEEFNLMDQEFKQGGLLTEYNAGGSHEQNPHGGIPVGQNEKGGMNLVEQGETRHGDYIYSNEYKLSEKDAQRFRIHPKYIGKSYSDISKEINDEVEERPYDRIVKKTADGNLKKLMMAQESVRQQDMAKNNNQFNLGGSLTEPTEGTEGTEPLNQNDIDAVNKATGLEFNENTANSLFSRTGGQGMDTPEPLNFGIYKDYFTQGNIEDGVPTFTNTPQNPHNAHTVKQLMDYVQSQNPNREMRFNFTNPHTSHNLGGRLTEPTEGTEGETKKLNDKDVQNVNQATDIAFNKQAANSLFSHTGGNGLDTPEPLNFGIYKDYFTQGNIQDGIPTFTNTPDNPHNAHTVRQLMDYVQSQNPGREMKFNFTNPHTSHKLGGIVGQGLKKGATGSQVSGAIGGITGAAGTALSLGQQAFGDTGVDTSGKAGRQSKADVGMGAAGGALQGAAAGAAFGPLGAAVGGALGLGAGLIGGLNKNKDVIEANKNASLIANNEFRNTYDKGGLLDTYLNHGGPHYPSDPNDTNPPTLVDKRVRDQVNERGIFSLPFDSYVSPPRTGAPNMDQGIRRLFDYQFNDPGRSIGHPADPYSPVPNTAPVINSSPDVEKPVSTSSSEPYNADTYIDFVKASKDLNELHSSSVLSPQEQNAMKADAAVRGIQGLQQQIQSNPGLHNSMTNTTPSVPVTATEKDAGAENPGTKTQQGDGLEGMGVSELLKYAPVASNLLNYFNTPKARVEKYDRLDNRYQRNYVDEKQLENRVGNSAANTRAALMNASGGSASAARANLLGSQVNETQALSDAMMKAQETNRQEDNRAQQFNLGVDQYNQRVDMQETIANGQNQDAREMARNNYLQSAMQDLGTIGQQATQARNLRNLTGYQTDGRKAGQGGMGIAKLAGEGYDELIQAYTALLEKNKKEIKHNG